MSENNKKVISCVCEEEIYETLKKYALIENRSLSNFIVTILEKYLEKKALKSQDDFPEKHIDPML